MPSSSLGLSIHPWRSLFNNKNLRSRAVRESFHVIEEWDLILILILIKVDGVGGQSLS